MYVNQTEGLSMQLGEGWEQIPEDVLYIAQQIEEHHTKANNKYIAGFQLTSRDYMQEPLILISFDEIRIGSLDDFSNNVFERYIDLSTIQSTDEIFESPVFLKQPNVDMEKLIIETQTISKNNFTDTRNTVHKYTRYFLLNNGILEVSFLAPEEEFNIFYGQWTAMLNTLQINNDRTFVAMNQPAPQLKEIPFIGAIKDRKSVV